MDKFFCYSHGSYQEKLRSLTLRELAKEVHRSFMSLKDTEPDDEDHRRSLEEYTLASDALAMRILA